MTEDSASAPRPSQRPFQRRHRPAAPAPDRAKRQWLITHLALGLLGGRDGAMAFLNTHNETLGQRPLDLAMDSAAGYSAVEDAIRLLARPHLGAVQ